LCEGFNFPIKNKRELVENLKNKRELVDSPISVDYNQIKINIDKLNPDRVIRRIPAYYFPIMDSDDFVDKGMECLQERGLTLFSGPYDPNSRDPWPEGGIHVEGTCFIATAATGGPYSQEVQFLRDIRDNTLLQTRTGRKLFEEFYSHYYRFSPAIAGEMNKNPSFKKSMNLAFVTPLLNYYRLAVTRPEWELNNVPEQIRDFLKTLSKDMDEWLANFPIPYEFESLSADQSALELSVVLKYMLRSSSARMDYLNNLKSRGILPLKSENRSLKVASQILSDAGISNEEQRMILQS
jgi:hypothetical protein